MQLNVAQPRVLGCTVQMDPINDRPLMTKDEISHSRIKIWSSNMDHFETANNVKHDCCHVMHFRASLQLLDKSQRCLKDHQNQSRKDG